MDLVPLGELGEVVSGSTPKTHIPDYWDGDIPWITPADLSGNRDAYFRGTLRKITKAGFDSCSTRMLPAGTILFSSRAPIGHCAIASYPLCTNQGFKSLVPNQRLDSLYGYYALRYTTPTIVALGRGATFAEINKEMFESVRIPVPPLDEQKRIAALLSKADRLRRSRRYAHELSSGFLQSVFLEMFGDPVTNTKGWQVAGLRDLSTRFSDGPFGSDLKSSHYTEHGVRVIRLQNIGIGELIDSDKAFISREHFESLIQHRCVPGDVIVGTLGDPNLRACVLPPSIPEALNKADCVQIRADPECAFPEYLCWLLNLPGTLHLASRMILGETRTRISMGRLAELRVPVAPLDEQRKFVEVVRRTERLRKQQQETSRQAELLFQTLLHQAFSECT